MSEQATNKETCDRCHETISDVGVALGWPVCMGDEYICPSCYGDDAFCKKCGDVLAANEDAKCAKCEKSNQKTRTITITGRRPVKIVESEWPVIAAAKDYDGQIEFQANRSWVVRVRQHADGRAIVYGVFESRWEGERGLRGGELLDADGDIVGAIRTVSDAIGASDRVARECIANLPAEEI